jgi:hypothetical protein
MKLSSMCFRQKTAIIIGNDERGLIFVSIMISKQCTVIWCISVALPLTIFISKTLLVSLCILKQRKMTIFLTREMPQTKLRHRKPLHKSDHLYLIVQEMLRILLTHSDSLSSLTVVHIRI